jgi:type IV pilus assembly protein PilW
MNMKQFGFTLIEMMIALVVSAFVLSGVMFTYISMKVTTSDTLEIGELQESGRLAMDILRKDIELTGFWATYYGSTLDAANVTAPAAPVGDCFEGSNNGSFPNDPTTNFRYLYGVTTTTSSAINCISSAIKNSDVIQIKHLDGQSISVADSLSNQFYFMSEYNQGSLSAGTSENIDPLSPNASLWGYTHNAYYISEQTYSLGSKSITVPVLMRKRLTANGFTTESIMEGVENLRFLYGLDIDGDNRVDTYKTAVQMSDTDWEQTTVNILNVQIFLLIRAFEEDANSTASSKTYVLGGDTEANQRKLSFNDKYRRALFVSTIHLLNGGDQGWRM